MQYHIRHVSEYRYTAPVLLEPQILRFRPRHDAWQRLIHFELTVEPEPAGIGEYIELDGNTVARFWMYKRTAELRVTAHSVTETLKDNPFDFLPDGHDGLPMHYAAETGRLREYVRPRYDATICHELMSEVKERTDGDPLQFLFELNQHIYSSLKMITRTDGLPWEPLTTWEAGEGACRDLAILFMEVARHAGFAARFVSGYHAGGEQADEAHLHAWAEVYVPGGGWRGYDPSTGLVVADHHVAVAAAPDPVAAAPVSGSFRGDGAISSLEFDLAIEARHNAPAA
jgi:transglutaminase-like putative cysteine protease